MDEKPSAPRESHPARNTAIGVVVALLLYVLSSGPVVRLMIHEKAPLKPVEIFYAPLAWLSQHDRNISGPFLNWYVGLWIGDILVD